MESFKYVKIEIMANTDDKRIKLRQIVEQFKSLAKANGLAVESHEEVRIPQTRVR